MYWMTPNLGQVVKLGIGFWFQGFLNLTLLVPKGKSGKGLLWALLILRWEWAVGVLLRRPTDEGQRDKRDTYHVGRRKVVFQAEAKSRNNQHESCDSYNPWPDWSCDSRMRCSSAQRKFSLMHLLDQLHLMPKGHFYVTLTKGPFLKKRCIHPLHWWKQPVAHCTQPCRSGPCTEDTCYSLWRSSFSFQPPS